MAIKLGTYDEDGNLISPSMSGDKFKTEMENALDKRGDIMDEGATLTLGKDPENKMDAVTKQYLEVFQKPWELDGIVDNISNIQEVGYINGSTDDYSYYEKYVPMINSGNIRLSFSGISIVWGSNANITTYNKIEVFLNNTLKSTIYGGVGSSAVDLSVNKGDKIIIRCTLRKANTGSSSIQYGFALQANIDTPYKYLHEPLYDYITE